MTTSDKSYNGQDRAEFILNQLLEHQYVLVKDLAQKLNVAEVTIRKDLNLLEDQGLVTRIHGGAIHVSQLTDDIQHFYDNRTVTHVAEKNRIGKVAATYITSGETIAFSSGSTPLQIVNYLPSGLAFTAVTNDLTIVQGLTNKDDVDIFVPGGYLRLGRATLIGNHAIDALRTLEIDKVFLTVTALDLDIGATAGHITNVLFLRQLVKIARQCIVVADHSKFENPSQIVICSWDQIDLLITDSDIPDTIVTQLKQKAITVVTA